MCVCVTHIVEVNMRQCLTKVLRVVSLVTHMRLAEVHTRQSHVKVVEVVSLAAHIEERESCHTHRCERVMSHTSMR